MLSNPLLLRAKNVLRARAPWILYTGSRVAARTVLYRRERAYLAGNVIAQSALPSVLFFTTIRCASQFVASVVRRIYESAGGTGLDLPRCYFHAWPSRAEELRDAENMRRVLKARGFTYGALPPIRGEFNYGPYRVVAGVRDPRDIIVSFYYSLAHAHTPSDRKFARDAAEARDRGIDWFVRQPERLEMVGEPLRALRDTFLGREEILFYRYEDMMADFEGFIRNLSGHIVGEKGDPTVVEAILTEREQTAPKAGKENLLSHRRSGESGAFRKKLSAETADFLTEEFADVLEAFDYST